MPAITRQLRLVGSFLVLTIISLPALAQTRAADDATALASRIDTSAGGSAGPAVTRDELEVVTAEIARLRAEVAALRGELVAAKSGVVVAPPTALARASVPIPPAVTSSRARGSESA